MPNSVGEEQVVEGHKAFVRRAAAKAESEKRPAGAAAVEQQLALPCDTALCNVGDVAAQAAQQTMRLFTEA